MCRKSQVLELKITKSIFFKKSISSRIALKKRKKTDFGVRFHNHSRMKAELG
jgi:hypothetical protein